MLKDIKQEIRNNYNLSDKDFTKLFNRTMDNKYVKQYIVSAFREEYGAWLDKECMEAMEA